MRAGAEHREIISIIRSNRAVLAVKKKLNEDKGREAKAHNLAKIPEHDRRNRRLILLSIIATFGAT